MPAIPLVAKKPQDYKGRALRTGDRFTAAPLEAASLVYKRLADFAPTKTTPSDAPKPKKSRRKYQTRDLEAEA